MISNDMRYKLSCQHCIIKIPFIKLNLIASNAGIFALTGSILPAALSSSVKRISKALRP